MVLTEERQVDPYPMASLEEGTLATEQLYYHIPVDGSTRVHKQSISGYPEDGSTNPNDYVHKLNGSGSKLGTSLVLKVMSGDTINLRANSWYRLNGETPDEPVSPLNDLLTALASGISQKTFGKFTNTQLLGSGLLSPGISGLLNRQSYSAIKPKAYVNWILFDEQFKYVNEGSGFDQVGSDEEFKTHFLAGLQVPKNGYLYIYVSNETPNVDVFFDNLQVTHVRGPLLEETHYYPFGLTMAGISSKAAGKMENKNDKFQGQPLDDDLGVIWYGFKYRNHDPQIGRFIEIDPLANDYVHNSTYAFSENKVTAHIELEGLEAMLAPRLYSWAASEVRENPNSTTSKVIGAVVGAGRFIGNAVTAPYHILKNAPGNLANPVAAAFNKYQAVTETLNTLQNGTGFEKAAIVTEATLTVLAAAEGIRTGFGAAAAEGEMTTLYRGVNESHVGYADALKGKVTPRGGTATAAEHNAGNTNSPFTSWTTNQAVAENYALRPEGGGVVLQTRIPQSKMIKSPNLKQVQLKTSGQIVSESEVLLKGKIDAIKITNKTQ